MNPPKGWTEWYQKIVQELGIDSERDYEARNIMHRLARGRSITVPHIRGKLNGRGVIVFGAGPSLELDAEALQKEGCLESCLVMTADGATSCLLLKSIRVPDIIVTDLDGNIEDQLEAHRKGSIMVIHAHGDNIPTIEAHAERFSRFLATTQVEPTSRVHNFGGFTDGDRAVFLAAAMGAKIIILAGMDLGSTVGKFSKVRAFSHEGKLKKLRIAGDLLEWLAANTKTPIYNVTKRGEIIRGISKVNPEEASTLLR